MGLTAQAGRRAALHGFGGKGMAGPTPRYPSKNWVPISAAVAPAPTDAAKRRADIFGILAHPAVNFSRNLAVLGL